MYIQILIIIIMQCLMCDVLVMRMTNCRQLYDLLTIICTLQKLDLFTTTPQSSNNTTQSSIALDTVWQCGKCLYKARIRKP